MTRYLENNYQYDTIACWPELRVLLRSYLASMVEAIMHSCSKVCMERGVFSTNERPIDMSMYSGSTGVLFGLYKYMLLLRKEIVEEYIPEKSKQPLLE